MKRSPKLKVEPISPEQEKDQVRREVIDILLTNARKGDNRSIDLLGRLKDFDLFTRPDIGQQHQGISEETARRLVAIAERLERRSYESPHPDDCCCPRCAEIRFDRRLKDQPLQPEPEPVDWLSETGHLLTPVHCRGLRKRSGASGFELCE
jgi:hypothetical protein